MHGPDYLNTIQYMLLKDTVHIRNKRELLLAKISTTDIPKGEPEGKDSGPTFGWDANPVEITGEFLGHVSLSPCWQADHHDHRWGIGHIRSPGCTEGRRALMEIL